ncbi:VAN3-binding protein-like [Tripterygium wilfordii]|uniref:VAN3-binding protein-like n=1 Tax=Tripterygium wilfordii TaxID=458696 RepID=UPI0018F8330D|nr:VAN3-binding protein-like [Tripterygium wilfordii]
MEWYHREIASETVPIGKTATRIVEQISDTHVWLHLLPLRLDARDGEIHIWINDGKNIKAIKSRDLSLRCHLIQSKVQYKHRFINAALRGAATLRARLQKGHPATTFVLAEEKVEECRESNISTALNFACSGGELLKRTRKGALHWKQVSFNINSKWQVVAKMKSKYMAVAFTKKKKYAISGVQSDVPAWPRREIDDGSEQKAYFGIITADRIIEFECKSKGEKHMWIEGIQCMLNCANIPYFRSYFDHGETRISCLKIGKRYNVYL